MTDMPQRSGCTVALTQLARPVCAVRLRRCHTNIGRCSSARQCGALTCACLVQRKCLLASVTRVCGKPWRCDNAATDVAVDCLESRTLAAQSRYCGSRLTGRIVATTSMQQSIFHAASYSLCSHLLVERTVNRILLKRMVVHVVKLTITLND